MEHTFGLEGSHLAQKLTNATTGGPVHVYVENGRIVRITPLEFDETDAPSWEIEARGKRFSPPRRASVAVYTSGMKSMIYSPDRILRPLKRVDFDPNGARNCTKRGISSYVPISWDEALDITANEILRIKSQNGAAAIAFAHSSHQMWGNVGYWQSCWNRFKTLVGFTDISSNPDSWEGWHWGAMHNWGFSWRRGIPEQYDLLEDAMQHTQLIVFWSSDPEATSGVYAAHEGTPRRFWLKELGIEMVCIDPYLDHTGKLFADKWIAPRMGTDNCLALAIAYVWITEDLYDKPYIRNRTLGFDQWKAYVLGETDGVPKTPAWAEAQCDVPAREIRALARKWGTSRTMLAAGGIGGFGGACRRATGNEWTRLMVCLAAMQGLGKPGSNIWSTQQGTPVDTDFYFPGYSEGGIAGDPSGDRKWNIHMFQGGGNVGAGASEQTLMKQCMPEAIVNGADAEWYPRGTKNPQQQLRKMHYPMPGCSPIKMMFRFGGSSIGTQAQSDRFASMYQTDNLEFVVSETIWMEGEAKYADIILPACTNFERWDISEFAHASGYLQDSYTQNNHRIISLQKKCIEPLGESRSDYRILSELADRLGIGDIFTDGGKTDLDWVRQVFDASDLPKYITWDEFFKKGYFVVPDNPRRKKAPALRWFAEDRQRDTPDTGPSPSAQVMQKGLQTTSGKLEFVSSDLKRWQGEDLQNPKMDPERPIMPMYIPSWEGPQSPIAKKYPLSLLTPHPRYSMHTMGDGKDSFMNDIPDHRVLVDGYYYWVARMNPLDAQARGLKDGELVLLYNDRAGVVCALQITHRVRPGVVHSYGSSAVYDPLGEIGASVDRAGCVNILTSKRPITPTSSGQALDCQLEVKRWEGETVSPGRKEGAKP
jgi:trimethylamine-N-oxide reductase (cytochrome c)